MALGARWAVCEQRFGSFAAINRFRMNCFRKIATDCRGQEIAEAALVLPLVFMLLLGIVWFGRAFNIYATLNRAAREGALAAASPTCATCGNNFAQNTTDIQSVVDSTLRAAHLDPGQVQNFTLTQDVALNPGSNPVEYVSVVSLSYPWNVKLNGVTCCPLSLSPITTGITITAQAQPREER